MRISDVLRQKKQSQSTGFQPELLNTKSEILKQLIFRKNGFFCKFWLVFKTNISVMAERIGDELLVEQSIRNNEISFESLVEQYSEDVALLANRLLSWPAPASSGARRGGGPGEVEDITQEVFLAAFLGLKKFRYDCSIRTWLFTITINKCRSFRYKQLFRRRKILDKPQSKITAADRKIQVIETSKKVRNAVQALPAKYREAVVLKYLEELPTEEISRILGISVNTLHVRLSRARERLKNDLKEIMEL